MTDDLLGAVSRILAEYDDPYRNVPLAITYKVLI